MVLLPSYQIFEMPGPGAAEPTGRRARRQDAMCAAHAHSADADAVTASSIKMTMAIFIEALLARYRRARPLYVSTTRALEQKAADHDEGDGDEPEPRERFPEQKEA